MRFSVLFSGFRKRGDPVKISIGVAVLESLACALPLARAAAEDDGEPSRVRGLGGERVAIYAATNSVRDAVVAWVSPDTELALRGDWSDDAVWLRIDPPNSVNVWIYRELVANNVVRTDKSRVRAGAGLTFSPVASLRKGDRVEVRGAYGDWLKIKPPAGLSFWVLRDQVEPLAVMPPSEAVTNGLAESLLVSLATNLPPSEADATNGVSAVSAVPAEPMSPVPVELAGAALEAGADQGARVAMTGLLDFGVVGDFPAPFSLVARRTGGDEPLCLLFAPAALDPAAHVGELVAVSGTRWRVKGVALPVIVADALRAE